MPPPPPSPPAPPRPPVRPHPKNILWVDDEVEGLAAHRQFLEQQGFTVEQAAHGDDALALLRRQPYSLVLLDEQMPGKRGLELLPEIRAIDPAMPVVMVTQSEEEALLREAIGIEVDDYLVKPVHPRQILSVITRLLEGDRIRQQRLAPPAPGTGSRSRGSGSSSWRSWRAGKCGWPPPMSRVCRTRCAACSAASARTSPSTSPANTRAGSRAPKATGRRCRWTWARSSWCR